jgi:hypothetical protein
MKTTVFSVPVAAARLAETAAMGCVLALALGSVPARAQGLKPILPFLPPSVSTVPPNGDVNPYGVAFVPRTILGTTAIQPGDILVSNFNNAQNLQGTGTTIVRVSQTGQASLFFQAPVTGLTGALGVLGDGIVVVGSLPTADGTAATVQTGSLLFIDPRGHLLGAVASPSLINGPWGLAIHDLGNGTAQIFVANVLSGTIVRLGANYDAGGQTVSIAGAVTIGSGFSHRTDPAALVLGPSGLYYDAGHDLLYVASSADNAIHALAGAGSTNSNLGSGTVVVSDLTHLHGPLDIVLAPNGHLLVANSDGSNVDPNQPSELVEYTTAGQFVAQFSLDPNNGGAFGLNVSTIGWNTVRVAAVDDNANTLKLWTSVLQ